MMLMEMNHIFKFKRQHPSIDFLYLLFEQVNNSACFFVCCVIILCPVTSLRQNISRFLVTNPQGFTQPRVNSRVVLLPY